MDENGSLYVVDDGKYEVRRYRRGDSQGIVVAGGNGSGNRLDQLSHPEYVFVDRNHSVYVSDWENDRVMKWMEGAKQGIVVAGGQGEGNGLTQLSFPEGVVVDQLGTVYVADQVNNRIMRWPKGATQGSVIIGGNGSGGQSNQFYWPLDSEDGSLKTQQLEISFATSNKASKKYWMCSERECGVYIHTSVTDELLSISGDHNHSANPDQIEVKLLRDKMKERILAETMSITKIYDEEIVKANLSKAATAIIPTVVEYRSNMSKARRKNTPVIPSSVMFDIPELYQQTLAGKRFLFIDVFLKRGKDRILVFSSDQQLKILFESDTIFMDGTFDITPAHFKQVFLIHAHKFGQGLPVAFCLLPNKRGKTSTEL
ncbi:unnamed protein product, partial [Rotaria sp. Silwood1]